MSRVNEALKRSKLHSSPDPHGVKPRARVVDRSFLDQYVAEQRSDSSEVDRVAAGEGGSSPRTRRGGWSGTFSRPLAGKLVVSEDMGTFPVEQYRRLAAALDDLQIGRGLKTLMVSSALPGEGKTLTITNLALTLSESYQRRVLLVDADLRNPSIEQAFGLAPGAGLRDDLRSASGTLSALQVSSSLSVLPAGRADADPMAELGSDRLRPLIQDAASRFDWVLVDTPPVCLLPDAHLVARATDGVLLVIAAKATPYNLIGRAIAELGHDRIVGTVLNRAEDHALTAKDYYLSAYHRPIMTGA
jgi:capsular exopolysaccharide synthesis family protein